jgi:hypothetical protein
MPVTRWVDVPTPSGVTTGETATFTLPRGQRYMAVQLRYNDGGGSPNITTAINDIRIKVNGKTQRVMTADQLDDLNLLNGSQYGVQNSNKDLTIFFEEPWRRTNIAQKQLAWGTGGIVSLQIECDLASGLTSPTLAAKALVDNQLVEVGQAGSRQLVPTPLGSIIKTYRTNVPIVGTGWFDFTLPRRGNYLRLHAISANIDEIEIYTDNVLIRKVTQQENDNILANYGFNVLSNRFDLLFDYDQLATSALPMVNANGQRVEDFNIRFNMGSASAFTLIYQVLGQAD